MARSIGLNSVRYGSDTLASDWWLIDIAPRIFVTWKQKKKKRNFNMHQLQQMSQMYAIADKLYLISSLVVELPRRQPEYLKNSRSGLRRKCYENDIYVNIPWGWYEDLWARRRYQGQEQESTSHGICGMQLFVPGLDTGGTKFFSWYVTLNSSYMKTWNRPKSMWNQDLQSLSWSWNSPFSHINLWKMLF